MSHTPDWTELARTWATGPLRLGLEWRAGVEWGAFLSLYPLLQLMPPGDGHPVLIYPYLFGTDLTTQPLREALERIGYRTHSWEQGLNLGPRAGVMEVARERLLAVHRRYGRKVSLIGWSAGGLYARELAKEMPDAVRQVITLGTPITGFQKPADTWRMVEQLIGEAFGLPESNGPLDAAPPVPTTAIFSRTDGIVPWRDSYQAKGPLCENIEVESSHLGLGFHPLALFAIADRLAQPEDAWQPFVRDGVKAAFYPDPDRDGWL